VQIHPKIFLSCKSRKLETEIKAASSEGEKKDIYTLDFTFPIHPFRNGIMG
jgi:hypothetical protein